MILMPGIGKVIDYADGGASLHKVPVAQGNAMELRHLAFQASHSRLSHSLFTEHSGVVINCFAYIMNHTVYGLLCDKRALIGLLRLLFLFPPGS